MPGTLVVDTTCIASLREAGARALGTQARISIHTLAANGTGNARARERKRSRNNGERDKVRAQQAQTKEEGRRSRVDGSNAREIMIWRVVQGGGPEQEDNAMISARRVGARQKAGERQ